MPVLERRISLRGPRFWIDGDELMFCNQIDGSTRDGPRPAEDEDLIAFPAAYEAMEVPAEPFKPMIERKDPPVKPPPEPKPLAERRNRTLED